MSRITIVMYHYVRDLPHTRYPAIKGLLASHFVEQLDYMSRHYQFVTMEDCINAVYGAAKLPKNGVLLTFDDGYADHFSTVFPLLNERGIQGCFFPPAKAIWHDQVLDVNKIHYVLASSPIEDLLKQTLRLLNELRPVYGLESNEAYLERLMQDDRFDSREVIFIKRLLQHGLPRAAREQIVSTLFEQYVTRDEKAFSRELYMSLDQLRCMIRNGMYVGSHGHDHFWLDTLPPGEQACEVDLSIEFLTQLGSNCDSWVMCYPFGSYNKSLIDILRSRGCKLGLTTKADLATLSEENAFTLERLDTNDLPKARGAKPNHWTELAAQSG